MLRNIRFISVVMAFMLCFSALAFGQGTSGGIEGTVADSTGAVIPGATVRIVSSGSTAGFDRTVTTNDNGSFYVTRLSPGTYKVTAEGGGFKASDTTVTVVIDKVSKTALKLVAAGTTTTVDVTADGTATIDPSDTKIDTNITKQIIEQLPKGIGFASLLKIAPNVRPEALGGGFQIDGASGSENVFVIDGQEVTNFRTGVLNSNNNLPLELLQEVQVKSTGFEAEYGGATGGVINAVTAGGNNQWRGSVGISFKPSKLQGDFTTVLNRYGTGAGQFEQFNRKKDGGTDWSPTATFSGPIVKDKMWGLVSYAPQIISTSRMIDYFSTNFPGRTVVSSERYDQTFKTEAAFARIDAQPMSKLRVYGTFLWNPIIQDGSLPGTTAGLQSTAPTQDVNTWAAQGGRQNSNSINGQATYTVNNWMVLNFRGGRSFLNEKLGSYAIPNITRFRCIVGNGTDCATGFSSVPTVFTNQKDVSTRTTYDVDASFIGIQAGGRHNIKVGYQRNELFNDVLQGYPETGEVRIWYGLKITDFIGTAGGPSIPGAIGAGYLQRFGTVGKASSTNQGIFAQDSWQIMNRLTLNFGIRIEKEVVPSFGNAATTQAIEFGWGDKPAPRFGIAYDLTGDGKTKLFGSYGWFYDRFKYELPRGSFGGDFFRRDYFEVTAARGTAPTNYTLANVLGSGTDVVGGTCPTTKTGWSVCQNDFRIATNSTAGNVLDRIFESGAVDPDIKAARQSEYTIGIERQLGTNFLFAGRYTHKQVDRAVEDIGVFNDQGSEAYIIGNPGLGLVCQISTSAKQPCTKAIREYDAVEVRVDRRADNYFFNANYTYSRLFGNYSGLASSDEGGRTSPNVNRFFDLPMLGYNANGVPDDGRLATDRPHVFKAYGGYSYNWSGSNRTSVSAFTTAQSGTPLTSVYTNYAVGSAILYGRGDLGRTEMFTETDFHVSHRYKFGRDNRWTFETYVEIRNIFDENNELTRQTSLSSTDFRASNLTSNGCTTCSSEAAVFDTIFNRGGIQQFVVNFLNNQPISSSGNRNDFNEPTSFQSGRDVNFGFRFFF